MLNRSDLFQHRLLIPSSPDDLNKWTKVYVPLSSFVLTNSGALSETQVGMMRNKVRTVGLSLLASEREAIDQSNGGGSLGVDGRFELGIRSVEAVNLGDRCKCQPPKCGLWILTDRPFCSSRESGLEERASWKR